MIKILFLIHDLGPGGAEKVLVNLVNNMDQTLFDITVMALFGGGVNEKFLRPNIRYQVIHKNTHPMNSQLMKLFSPEMLHRTYIRERYDIEVSYLEGPSARIISGCTDKSTRLISWIHVEQHSKRIAAYAFRTYRESVECYERFHNIVAVSDYVRNDFKTIYPNVHDITVLYNTIETDTILRLKDENVLDVVFSKDELKICGVGKIVPVKGFLKLARIHKRLIDNGYPIHTYLLGDGDEKKKIEKYIRKNGLEKTFTFLGYQMNPYKFIANCDVFVCTSSAEGFSTAATEALILGTAVVTTPVSGMPEMLGDHNDYGIITDGSEDDLYETIKKLVDTPELLSEYKARAKKRGRIFSLRSTVHAVEEMLKHIKDDSSTMS